MEPSACVLCYLAGVAGKLSDAQRLKIFGALADGTRLRFVELLASARQELTGSEIAECLGVSLALQCHHAKALSEAGLLIRRKSGQSVYYSLNQAVLTGCLRSLGR